PAAANRVVRQFLHQHAGAGRAGQPEPARPWPAAAGFVGGGPALPAVHGGLRLRAGNPACPGVRRRHEPAAQRGHSADHELRDRAGRTARARDHRDRRDHPDGPRRGSTRSGCCRRDQRWVAGRTRRAGAPLRTRSDAGFPDHRRVDHR
ncbi:hypothetical protein OY671_012679, partial [Metschnikowia pulcherrima]